MNKVILILIVFQLVSCTPKDFENVLNSVMTEDSALTNEDIGNGLKEALTIGIGKGSDILSKNDGYFKSIYKIALPPEAIKVTDKISQIPLFSDIENTITEKINHAAEDAATKAKPIFVNAIKSMTINDALNILMGEKDAATVYLRKTTYSGLQNEFEPVIVNSLNKFNALDYWSDAVTAYNKLPFTEKLNPKLESYITEKALDGLFKMVAKEELAIRKDPVKRVTDLLKKVFAKQD